MSFAALRDSVTLFNRVGKNYQLDLDVLHTPVVQLKLAAQHGI